jgi:hypothetical protein
MDTGRIGHLDGDTQKSAIRRAGDGAFDDSPDKPQRLVHVHPPERECQEFCVNPI